MLKAKQTIYTTDLYQISLVGGWQSRATPGFVARWTSLDYPVKSSYLNSVVADPVKWPTIAGYTGTFYPQRMTRSSIEYKIGFEVSTLEITVFTNDTAKTQSSGTIKTAALPLDLSIPSYRDAFSVLASDNSTVVETLKTAAWRGELDQAYVYVFRAFFINDPRILATTGKSTDPFGIMPIFTGYVKQFSVNSLSVKMSIGSLIDIFTTTQTPTQVIESGDRGGATFIPTDTIPQLSCAVQSGSTPLALIGNGTAPTGGTTTQNDEPHFIPSIGPFTITVAHSAAFIADVRVRDASTGQIFVKVGSSPKQSQYTVSAGVYTFNSADKNLQVSISYTWNNTGAVEFSNGWIQYTFGSEYNRPANTPVIRQVRAWVNSPGANVFYLFEPMPIAPSTSDSFIVYQQQSLDLITAQPFPFVQKPEATL